MKLLALLYIK